MANATLVNFAGGETSPKSRGRFDIASYNSSCRKLVNFIAEVSGPARFRPGFKWISELGAGNPLIDAGRRIIPFHLNTEDAFLLEFTPAYMRVYRNGQLVTNARTTITAISQANPCEITVADRTGIASGDDIIITGVVGMTEINNRMLRVYATGAGAGVIRVLDMATYTNLDSTNFGAYVSGGAVAEVYRIASPYRTEDDFKYLSFTQTPTTMYFTSPRHAPRKLTVDIATGTWTLATYSRTNDPFVAGAAINISGATIAAKCVLTLATPAVAEDVVTIAGVVGMTQLNGQSYRLERIETAGGSPTYYLKDPSTDDYLNTTTGFGAYTSGGTATPIADCPIAVAFYEGRLVFAGTNRRPNTLFLSRAPDDAGAARYDDFTGGTDADHACFFTLAPSGGSVDYITWAGGTNSYLLIGTFGGTFRVSGGGLDEPITPSAINVRQLDAYGCAPAASALNGSHAYFIQRGGVSLRTAKYAADADDFATEDLCLNSEQVAFSPLSRVVLQTGRPDVLWVLRDDGQLAAMTVEAGERITGWHRHNIGGNGRVLDIAVLPRTTGDDRLYIVTERTIDGATRRYVEVMADDVIYPDPEDFYTAESAQAANEEDYMDAVYRLQERYIHIDAASTYNGSDAGVAAGATLTPSATTVGTGRTFTASASVFTAADVGKEIWKKPSAVDGTGSGRATITAYTSATEVTAEITAAFDSATAIPAGDWYLAADEISGLSYLEGERVAVVADGAVYSDGKTTDYPTVTVTNGAIALSRNCAVVHVGLPYEGMLITHNLEMGGSTGPAQDKPRNIARMAIRFLNSLGCEFGTSLYRTEKVVHNSNKYVSDRPTPVFSGVKIVHNSDTWKPDSGDKNVVVVQKLPLPCVVQFIDVHYETGDEA